MIPTLLYLANVKYLHLDGHRNTVCLLSKAGDNDSVLKTAQLACVTQ